MYLPYKGHLMLKWLTSCDPIGSMAGTATSKMHGGLISDPLATYASDILKVVPFGSALKLDKGFLIENFVHLWVSFAFGQ